MVSLAIAPSAAKATELLKDSPFVVVKQLAQFVFSLSIFNLNDFPSVSSSC
jgi:hypothetical protein